MRKIVYNIIVEKDAFVCRGKLYYVKWERSFIMRYLYTAVFTPLKNGTGYIAEIPDIPHCVTSGRDLADALDQIVDAATLMLVAFEDDRKDIPSVSPHTSFHAPESGAVSLVSLDTNSYRIRTNVRAVRKNVSLPAWMAEEAQKRGVNCSQVLQDALRELLK